MIGSPGLTALDYVLEQIAPTWTTEDTIVYANRLNVKWNKTWEWMPVASGVNSWNEADMDEDGSFMVIAADDGLYISTDTGVNWTLEDPGTETYSNVQVDASSGKAVALGDTSKETGWIWGSSDSGLNWEPILVGGSGAE